MGHPACGALCWWAIPAGIWASFVPSRIPPLQVQAADVLASFDVLVRCFESYFAAPHSDCHSPK